MDDEIEVAKLRLHRLWYITDHMRQSDIEECQAISCVDCHAAVEYTYRHTDRDMMWTVQLGGEPVLAFGCARRTVLSTTGIPWLFGTDRLDEIGFTIARQSKKYIGKMLERYDRLENKVPADYEKSIRWFKFCGFTIGKEYTDHFSGVQVRDFWIERQ